MAAVGSRLGAPLLTPKDEAHSKYPPAEPGALEMGPLEAAVGVADAAPVVGAA
jgi:hypothetical protein